MVQILEDQPSFASQFMKSNMDTATAFTKAFMDERNKKKATEKENEAFDKFGIDLRGMSPELRQEFAKQFPKYMFQSQLAQQKAQTKSAEERQKKEEENQGLSEALDWLDENISFTGEHRIPFMKSFTAGGANRTAVGKRAEFDKTGFWAADRVYTHFNKGVLSEEKLKLLKDDLSPRAELSERENKARIASLRRISNLPKNAPSSVVNKQIDKEVRAMKKIGSSENKSGKVKMRAPNGQTVSMEKHLVDEALERGWTKE